MSSTRRRSAALLLALLMALGLVATAAPAVIAAESAAVSVDHALDGGLVMFRGRVKIRDTWDTGTCGGAASGLDFPGIPNLNGPGVVKCYHFRAPAGFPGGNNAPAPFCFAAGLFNGVFRVDACSIEVQGTLKGLAPDDPLGPFDRPRCGASASNGGTGDVRLVAAGKAVNLSNLGWPTSAGVVWPVTGNWDSADPAKAKGQRKVVALVKAGGLTKNGIPMVLACRFAKGADSFDLDGVAVLTPLFSADLPGPVNDLLKHPKKP